MTNLLPRYSGPSAVAKEITPGRLNTGRRAFLNPFGLGKSSASTTGYNPFLERRDSADAIIGLRGEGGSSRPSSIYSFDNLPRPSVESQFHAWGSHDRASLRASPLAPDWSASQTWSGSHSRRPSVQYGSTSNLSLGAHPDEDFLDPPREPQRPLQAPIGTRPTSSQRPQTPKLNPAAPSFTTQFFSKRVDKTKENKARGLEKSAPDAVAEDDSPPEPRRSRDSQPLATNASIAESRESLEQCASAHSGGNPSETTSAKETKFIKFITRKSSSSKFNSWKEKGGLFSSRKGESSNSGEIDEDGASSDHQPGKGAESTSSTAGEKEKEERPKGNRSSLSWSFIRKSRRGIKEDLTASEVSESSERASDMGDEETVEERDELHDRDK